MADKSRATKAVEKAREMALAGYERAKGHIADIPLGQERVDPRTHKKRQEEQKPEPGMESTLSRMLYEMRVQHENNNQGGQ